MINHLGGESSPYLLQHRHNPVHWWPWGQDALDKAANENKLIIVSIGYSACHWCHVMERESFENQQIAEVMNRHFIAVKIDREERPDIDQIYMIAVQLMTNSGGWPLNCICLPDGKPIYGGTYFRPNDWQSLLLQLQQMWETNPDAAYDYAGKLAAGIAQSDRIPPLVEQPGEPYQSGQLEAIVRPWRATFDHANGGLQRSPKFPMPGNWDFLLQYGVLEKDQDLIDHVHFTLKKIASGGIYDHVGGGFARYSVDERWHVPHFEKMLYDNAQLVSLYLSAWQHHQDPQYLRTVRETLEWVIREMTAPDGSFYCALDADSEGVEGKFYTFTQEEIREALQPPESPFPEPGSGPAFSEEEIKQVLDYFRTSPRGNWIEESTNVLYHEIAPDELAEDFQEGKSVQDVKSRLLNYRSQRVRPGLDNKRLTSWNALMLKAFAEASRILDNQHYLEAALRNAAFIQEKLYTPGGGLLHQPADSNRAIPGFLDDYACCIDAFIALYEATFDEQWMQEAKRLTDYAIKHFHHPEEGIFYYTDDNAEALITRKAELMDNVMPSSNSTLLRCLQKLGSIFDLPRYGEIIAAVLPRMIPQMQSYGSAYSNWGILLLHEIHGTNEIILSGKKAGTMRKIIDGRYIPNKIVLGGTESQLPILQGRLSGQEKAFLCKNRTCSLPVNTAQEILRLID